MYDEYGAEFEPETRFDEMLDETYEAVHIGELTFDPSDILKSCDPVAYRVYLSDYESDMIESGEWSETDPTEVDLRPIDVWMIIEEDEDGDDVSSYEANVYHDNGRYRLDWEHTAVGLVASMYFDTYEEATARLERDGYQNFTDNTNGDYTTA